MASYGAEAVGFGDSSILSPAGEFEVATDPSAWQWHENGVAEAAVNIFPLWNASGEDTEHQRTIFAYHTEICPEFGVGKYCSLHRANGGKSTACFNYHFPSQQRREPVDQSTGVLLYWDVPCPHQWDDQGSSCPSGPDCLFAHNKEEISYHPAKYKTRRCNGKGCRGENVCCFAHSEGEERKWAAEKYSYWGPAGIYARGGPPKYELDAVEANTWPGADGEAWQRPAFAQLQPPATRHKHRFCASYPDIAQCRRGAACAFAHSREEAKTPLLTESEEKQVGLTDEFFMYKFKTLWCPIGVQHDWQTCVYAHNYQDARRMVAIGYGPKPCPYWSKKDASAEYAQRCPLGLRCPFSHGAKEQLYHPKYFRTVICRDVRQNKQGQKVSECPRASLCAFFHDKKDRRQPDVKSQSLDSVKRRELSRSKATSLDDTAYVLPLDDKRLPEEWVTDFLSPPFRDATHASPQDDAADSMQEETEVRALAYGGNNGTWIPGDLDAGGNGYGGNAGPWMPGDLNGAGVFDCNDPRLAAILDWEAINGCWPDLLAMNPGLCAEMSQLRQDGLPHGHSDMFGARSFDSPLKLLPESFKRDADACRFTLPSPVKLDAFEESRNEVFDSDEGDAADDASTSAGGDFLASTGSLLCQAAAAGRPAAGAIGAAKTVGAATGDGSSSASSSPWMIPSSQEPSWSPFGASFDGLNCAKMAPLSMASLWDKKPAAKPCWDPTEPAIVTNI